MPRKYKKLNERDFKEIKHLLGLGITQEMVARVVSRASCTVSFIAKCDTFKDYQEYVANAWKRQKNKNDKTEEIKVVRPEIEMNSKQRQIYIDSKIVQYAQRAFDILSDETLYWKVDGINKDSVIAIAKMIQLEELNSGITKITKERK